MKENDNEFANIWPVKDYLKIDNLTIPEYQRPYKWTEKNVNQLIDDIVEHKDKPAYRIGTIVLHRDDDKGTLNIVDGQQRTITFILIAHCLQEQKKPLGFDIPDIKIPASNIAHKNILKNFEVIKNRLALLDDGFAKVFLEKCELVIVTLTDVSEAFQFFDSQNARGKDLYPHDLLKAFHLREMKTVSKEHQKSIVSDWEEHESKELNELFGKYLFRIKNWIKNKPARFFTKNDVDVFKGISSSENTYPYGEVFRMADAFYEKYSASADRCYDNKVVDYPFQLDQPIINGRRFFDMTAHYFNLLKDLKRLRFNENYKNKELYKEEGRKAYIGQIKFRINGRQETINDKAKDIITTLATYSQNKRTGDRYVQILFDTALLYYIDRFGLKNISEVIEKYFLWAYLLRITQHSVFLKSMDNYARGKKEIENNNIKIHIPNLYYIIKESYKPTEALRITIPKIESPEKTSFKEITDLFIKKGLIENQ